MSIYASIEGIGDVGDPDELGQPWVYRGSHLTPADTDPRAGSIGLAVIPSHITADGRDDQPDDGAPWPFLRLHLDVPGDDPCVLINPAQARHLAEQLTTWADRAEPEAPVNAPGSTREQLPDHILDLIDVPAYTSPACETARECERVVDVHTTERPWLLAHAEELHARCRLNHEFTGAPCSCGCHQEQPAG